VAKLLGRNGTTWSLRQSVALALSNLNGGNSQQFFCVSLFIRSIFAAPRTELSEFNQNLTVSLRLSACV
jgi:hypothetical protein